MRKITPTLTPELERHVGKGNEIRHAEPYYVATYRSLVEHAARLAYHNADHLLFYRGQTRDYTNRRDGSTFYPSIYRGDHLARDTVEQRFEFLKQAGRRLHDAFQAGDLDGHTDLGRRQLVQWSVLQHYEVCATPLLDLTQSLRVACSFAQDEGDSDQGFVYLFGLPHISNRISVNSEHDLIVVRLLGMCPPSALRPYFQEGYLAGTADITTEYSPKTELDFNRRLIAKFAIPKHAGFWGENIGRMPQDELYPPHDSVKEICDVLELAGSGQPLTSGAAALGEFVAAWTAVEQLLIGEAQRRSDRSPTIREAIDVLAGAGILEPWIADELHQLRSVRNEVVHRAGDMPSDDRLNQATSALRRIRDRILKSSRRRYRGPAS